MNRKVAILGATGAVGQRYIELLQRHPWFEIEVLAASERSAGKLYGKACNWTLDSEMPDSVKEQEVVLSEIKEVEKTGDIDLVFSALPGDLAGPYEEQFAVKYPVISKASAHRMEEDIPLIIPEVNPEHLGLIQFQKENRGWEGYISTDPNCSTIQLAISLKPLIALGLKKVIVSTMQALSGAGHPGVSSLDIIDNVIPYIKNEEEKMESEPRKILGRFSDNMIREFDITISASCNRVNVRDGHSESVSVELNDGVDIDEVIKAFEDFKSEPQEFGLPSAPDKPIIVRKEVNRPQPRFDRNAGKGMSVVLGRVREDPVLTAKYLCLGHNTIRGAAGGGILHAELLAKKGYL
ncbi:MAG: aspartate-semialdehyde dehydrogenase [Thermoplasmata archaeon]